jgi:hypothetical protein
MLEGLDLLFCKSRAGMPGEAGSQRPVFGERAVELLAHLVVDAAHIDGFGYAGAFRILALQNAKQRQRALGLGQVNDLNAAGNERAGLVVAQLPERLDGPAGVPPLE